MRFTHKIVFSIIKLSFRDNLDKNKVRYVTENNDLWRCQNAYTACRG